MCTQYICNGDLCCVFLCFFFFGFFLTTDKCTYCESIVATESKDLCMELYISVRLVCLKFC